MSSLAHPNAHALDQPSAASSGAGPLGPTNGQWNEIDVTQLDPTPVQNADFTTTVAFAATGVKRYGPTQRFTSTVGGAGVGGISAFRFTPALRLNSVVRGGKTLSRGFLRVVLPDAAAEMSLGVMVHDNAWAANTLYGCGAVILPAVDTWEAFAAQGAVGTWVGGTPWTIPGLTGACARIDGTGVDLDDASGLGNLGGWYDFEFTVIQGGGGLAPIPEITIRTKGGYSYFTPQRIGPYNGQLYGPAAGPPFAPPADWNDKVIDHLALVVKSQLAPAAGVLSEISNWKLYYNFMDGGVP